MKIGVHISSSSFIVTPSKPMDILYYQLLQKSSISVPCSVFPQLQRSLIDVPCGAQRSPVSEAIRDSVFNRPYVVYNEQGYSKHYYAGAERVSSRLGGGTIYGLKHPINDSVSPIGSEGKEYPELATGLWKMLQRSFTNCLDLEAGYIGIEHRLNSVEHSAGNDNPENNWYIYHSDHLGSSSFLTDANGNPTQHLQYLPFGENFIEQRATTDYYTPYTFSAKERDPETGYSYFGARYYDPNVSVFISVDRFADKYPDYSPYHYCLNNPINLIDINGDSTFVTKGQDGTYTVYGGNIAGNDNGIYCKNGSGNYELIGYSATPQSFYNEEEKKWMGKIDPKNQDGKNFLNNLQKIRPGLLYYILNATGGKKFDFKRTNGTNSTIYSETIDHYRGMPLDLEGEDPTKPVFASARDVGNIGAGLIAGWNGLSWAASRLAFDTQHSRQKGRIEIESMSTQYAQRLGWRIGNQIYQKTELSRRPGNGHLRQIKISKSIIKKNFRAL